MEDDKRLDDFSNYVKTEIKNTVNILKLIVIVFFCLLGLLLLSTKVNSITWNSTTEIMQHPFSNTTGNYFFDTSTAKRDFLISGTVTLNTTAYVTPNGSVNFIGGGAGGNSYLRNDTANLGHINNSAFTISMWIHLNTWTSGSYFRLTGLGTTGSCASVGRFADFVVDWLNYNPPKLSFFGCSDDVDSPSIDSNVLNTTSWHLLILSYDNVTRNVTWEINRRVIFNGTIPTKLDILAPNVFLSASASGQNYPFEGQIDDYRLFSFILNGSQRENLWNNSHGNSFYNLDISPTASPPVTFLNVSCVGDSITSGYPSFGGIDYCTKLNNTPEVYTENHGYQGDGTIRLLNRSSEFTKPYNTTIILIGTNELDNGNIDRVANYSDFYLNMKNLSNQITNAGSLVLLSTIPPCNNVARNCSIGDQRQVITINNIIRRVSDELNLGYVDIFYSVFGGDYNAGDFSDTVHPNAAAQDRMNTTYFNALFNMTSYDCTLNESQCWNITQPPITLFNLSTSLINNSFISTTLLNFTLNGSLINQSTNIYTCQITQNSVLTHTINDDITNNIQVNLTFPNNILNPNYPIGINCFNSEASDSKFYIFYLNTTINSASATTTEALDKLTESVYFFLGLLLFISLLLCGTLILIIPQMPYKILSGIFYILFLFLLPFSLSEKMFNSNLELILTIKIFSFILIPIIIIGYILWFAYYLMTGNKGNKKGKDLYNIYG